MGWFNRFTKKNRAPRPNAITSAQTRRIGSVAAREQVRKANKSGARGSMLVNYNKASNNVQKGRNTVAERASAAYDRIRSAVERRHSENKNSYKNAADALEDEIDSRAKADLKEKVEEMEEQFDEATMKVINDYMADIKAEAIELSKNRDPNLIEKLKDALIKIMAEGDMSAPEPKIKKILVFILPIFLLIAPYISKLYKKFKYNPGDVAYDRLREFVDAMKDEKSGGAANNQRNTSNKGNSLIAGHTWHSNLFFSAAMVNLSMSDGSGEGNPFMLIALIIIFVFYAVIVALTIGVFVFDVLLLIKRAIFDGVKKAQTTGKVSEELERAAPQVATQNPLQISKNSAKNVRPPLAPPELPPPPINHKGPYTPSRWKKVVENGERWYENVKTGESSWTLPKGAVVV